jgi:hypothetical protein
MKLLFVKEPDKSVRMRVEFEDAARPATKQLEQGDALLAINADKVPVFMKVKNVHLRWDAVARQMADAPFEEPVELDLSYQTIEQISDACQTMAEQLILDWIKDGGK